MSVNLNSNDLDLEERIVVVSVIGKSSRGSNGCKADLVDEAIERNVFKHHFGDQLNINLPSVSNSNIR